MKEQLEALQQEALDSVSKTEEMKELQQTKVAFLGKKGSLTGILRGMGKLSKEERPVIGEMANRVRESITDRKSTRLNSSHVANSYAVFCLKKNRAPRMPNRSDTNDNVVNQDDARYGSRC